MKLAVKTKKGRAIRTTRKAFCFLLLRIVAVLMVLHGAQATGQETAEKTSDWPKTTVFVERQEALQKGSKPIYTVSVLRRGQEKQILPVRDGATDLSPVLSLTLSANGAYGAFFSTGPNSSREARLTTVADAIHACDVYIVSLAEQKTVRVPVEGVVDNYAWQPRGEFLLVKYHDAKSRKLAFYKPGKGIVFSWSAKNIRDFTWSGSKTPSLLCLDVQGDIVEHFIKNGKVVCRWTVPRFVRKDLKEYAVILAHPAKPGFLLAGFSKLYSYDMNKKRWRLVVASRLPLTPYYFGWSTDGKKLCYEIDHHPQSITQAPEEIAWHEEYIISLEGTLRPRKIFSWGEMAGEYDYIFMGWSPKSDALYYLFRTPGKGSELVKESVRDRKRTVVHRWDGYINGAAVVW